MEFVKITVLALSLGILCNATKRPRLHHHVLNQSGDINTVNSNCICLPKTEKANSLPAMIGGDLNWERLITYFYINPFTKQVTIYTPNQEKQKLFPDVSFDSGDILVPVLPSDNINNLVFLNSNKIQRVPATQNPINHKTIDKNINSMELISIPPNTANINKIISLIMPNNEHLPSADHVKENVIQNNEVLNDLTISPDDNAKIYIYSNDKPITDNINLDFHDNVHPLNLMLPSQDPGITPIQNIHQTPKIISDTWQTSSLNNVYNWNDYIFKYKDPGLDVQNVQTPAYLKFNQWFHKQMDSSLKKLVQNGVNFPEDSVLKNLVYKNLIENGIILMDDGILKSNQGHTLNLSNLKLQPILMPLSLGYENNPTHGIQEKVVPPYYGALALYTDHPQKILAIIPIHSDYGTDSMGYSTTNMHNLYPSIVTSTVLKTQCVNGKCYTRTVNDDITWRSGRPQETIKNDVNTDLFNKEQEKVQNKNQTRRIPTIKGLPSKVNNMVMDETYNKTIGTSTPKYGIPEVDEEGPEIRIVGGSAATGSGIPINNRGRSPFN